VAVDSRAEPSRATFWVVLLVLALVFLAHSLYLARVLIPSHDESSALFFGYLTASGQMSMYQDDVVGHRPPGPAYVFGITQVLWGRSLMAARLTSVGFGLVLLVLTALLGRRVGGVSCGLLAAALLSAQGAVVGYYSLGDFHALVPMVMVGGLLVWLSADTPARNSLGAAIIGSLFFVRTHIWPLLPLMLVLALRRARGFAERALIAGVMIVPLVLFFLWDVRHLKLLVSVPFIGRLVRPLGYVAFVELDQRPSRDLDYQIWMLAQLARRYEFLVLVTVVIGLLVVIRVVRSGRREPYLTNRPVNLLAGLFIYILVSLLLFFRINFKWVGMYVASIVPLLAIVLGYLASRLASDPLFGRWGRAGIIAFLATMLVLPIYYNRNPLMPLGALRAADPVRAVETAGAHLARLVPADARVFFFGQVDVFYFSGLAPTYLQQITNYDTLAVNDHDNAVSMRNGYYGMSQVERWLGTEVDYAVVSPQSLYTFAEAFHNHPEVNRPKVARIRELLALHFTKIGTVDEYPYYSYDVYRRVGRP